jgi:peptide/nickel transport system ATP-binding protein
LPLIRINCPAEILEMMAELRAEIGTAIVFITHDLGVVAEIADRVAVLYAGKIVEQTDVVSLFDNACHPYTRGLMRSIPRLSRQAGGAVVDRLTEIKGTVPAPTAVPAGCAFSPRCASATLQCAAEPLAEPLAPSHLVACWHPETAAVAEIAGGTR